MSHVAESLISLSHGREFGSGFLMTTFLAWVITQDEGPWELPHLAALGPKVCLSTQVCLAALCVFIFFSLILVFVCSVLFIYNPCIFIRLYLFSVCVFLSVYVFLYVCAWMFDCDMWRVLVCIHVCVDVYLLIFSPFRLCMFADLFLSFLQ